MNKKKPYALVNVKNVRIASVIAEHADQDVSVGIDIAKETLKVGLWWNDGTPGQPWVVDYPDDLPLLIQKLKHLAEGRKLITVLEPTGTYGDPLRWALKQAGLPMRRVDTKASHDYAEVFDGVPSNHDAKDALMLGKLGHQGDGRAWDLDESDERESKRRALVASAQDQQNILSIWTNRLEALLARHWPEATRSLDLGSATLLVALAEYGSPAALAADPQAAARLQKWGGRLLAPAKVLALLQSARTTAGVPANATEMEQIQRCALAARQADRELAQTRRQMAEDISGDEVGRLMSDAVGAATTCLLLALLGDPRDYHCAEAYVKAAGLNLKERSSGKYAGELKISKRGPSAVRKWLYLAALRLIERSGQAAEWFARYKARNGARRGSGGRAIVAIMRKLLRAMWHVARKKQAFDIHRLFPRAAKVAGMASSAVR